jgi:hypothetical protein
MSETVHLMLAGLLSTLPLVLVAAGLVWFHRQSKIPRGWAKYVLMLLGRVWGLMLLG